MRLAGIDFCECTNAEGWGITLYTQGCNRQCPGCFNPESWNFQAGKQYTQEDKDKILNDFKNKQYYSHFVIEGGEPLIPCNIPELLDLMLSIRDIRPDINFWCFTGFTIEELWKRCETEPELQEILNQLSVLVDGPFIQEQKDLTLAFRGSSNQRLIDMRQSSPSHIETLDI